MKTLLDEFAMAALTGLLANQINDGEPNNYAESAYLYANAMMEERKKHVKEDDGWIAWTGDSCPFNITMNVEVKFRNGEICSGDSDYFSWWHDGMHNDIIAYRIVK